MDADQVQALAAPVYIDPQEEGERGLLATLDVSGALGPQYVPLVHDFVRMVSIQVMVQLMLVLGAWGSRPFLSAEFLLTLTYIAMGVLLYWLLVRKLLVIT